MTRIMTRLAAFAAMAVCAAATPVLAGEGGGSTAPIGQVTYGTGALPPPGTYILNQTSFIHSGRLNDADGNKVNVPFELNTVVNATRLVHFTDLKILGANYGMQAILPVVSSHVSRAGRSGHMTGIGDITVSPYILSWHADKFHWFTATDIILPTGSYDRTKMVNLGRNYVDIAPLFTFTYLDPAGPEATIKVQYNYNTKNQSTKYQTGQELNFDYGAHWNFGPLAVGVGGYYLQQISDDERNGVKVNADGNRGKALSVGPQFKYTLPGVNLIGVWFHEVLSENRSQADRIALRVSFKL